MRLHRRVKLVEAARLELCTAVAEIAVKHKLTYGELVTVLAGELQSAAKYVVRWERHGRLDKKGDEA